MSKSLKKIAADFEIFSYICDEEIKKYKLDYALPFCALERNNKLYMLDTSVYELLRDCKLICRELASIIRVFNRGIGVIGEDNKELLSNVSDNTRSIATVLKEASDDIVNLSESGVELRLPQEDICELTTVWSTLKYCQRFLGNEFYK